MKTKKNSYKDQAIPRKLCVLFLLLSIPLYVFPSTVCAHSPSTQTVSYNLETQELHVTLAHQVNDPTTHYISTVEIKKNGVMYNTSSYTNQPDPSNFIYTFLINATFGDIFEVTSSCNLGGTKTTQYTIPTDDTDNGENNPSTPGFELLIFLIATGACLVLLRRKVH